MDFIYFARPVCFFNVIAAVSFFQIRQNVDCYYNQPHYLKLPQPECLITVFVTIQSNYVGGPSPARLSDYPNDSTSGKTCIGPGTALLQVNSCLYLI